MGMFDYVKCHKSLLPGAPPAYVSDDHEFQTKDFACEMATYEISHEGFLSREGGVFVTREREALEFTGAVEFYTTNITGSGPGLYTRNGEDADSVEYVATFLDGKMQRIVESSRDVKPALPSNMQQHRIRQPLPGSILEGEAKLIGRTVFVLWGGREPSEGYDATVVYANEKELAVDSENGIEKIGRFQIGNIVFADETEATIHYDACKKSWSDGKAEYDALLAARKVV